MNKSIFFIALVPLMMGCGACKGARTAITNAEVSNAENHQMIVKTLSLKDFDGIYALGTMNVVYTSDHDYSVKISGLKDDVDKVKASVSNGALVLSEPHHHLSDLFGQRTHSVTVYVSSPDLHEVDMKGAGRFLTKSKIVTEDFKVDISGTGRAVFGDINCAHFISYLSGTGDLRVNRLAAQSSSFKGSGTGNINLRELSVAGHTGIGLSGTGSMVASTLSTKDLSVETSGTGNATLEQIKASTIMASTSGAGNVLLDMKEVGNANVSASGIGSITVRGTYQHLQQDHSGLGHIHIE